MRLVSKLSAATLLLYAVSLHPGQVRSFSFSKDLTSVGLNHRGQNRQETHMSQMLYHQTIMVSLEWRPLLTELILTEYHRLPNYPAYFDLIPISTQ